MASIITGDFSNHLVCTMLQSSTVSFFFFFNDPAPPDISPLPLHDALPIFSPPFRPAVPPRRSFVTAGPAPEVTEGSGTDRAAPPRGAPGRRCPLAAPDLLPRRILEKIGRAHV